MDFSQEYKKKNDVEEGLIKSQTKYRRFMSYDFQMTDQEFASNQKLFENDLSEIKAANEFNQISDVKLDDRQTVLRYLNFHEMMSQKQKAYEDQIERENDKIHQPNFLLTFYDSMISFEYKTKENTGVALTSLAFILISFIHILYQIFDEMTQSSKIQEIYMSFWFGFMLNLWLLYECESPWHIKSKVISNRLKYNAIVFFLMIVTFLIALATNARKFATFFMFNAWIIPFLKEIIYHKELIMNEQLKMHCILCSLGSFIIIKDQSLTISFGNIQLEDQFELGIACGLISMICQWYSIYQFSKLHDVNIFNISNYICLIFLMPCLFSVENMVFPNILDIIQCFILGVLLIFSLNFLIRAAQLQKTFFVLIFNQLYLVITVFWGVLVSKINTLETYIGAVILAYSLTKVLEQLPKIDDSSNQQKKVLNNKLLTEILLKK